MCLGIQLKDSHKVSYRSEHCIIKKNDIKAALHVY